MTCNARALLRREANGSFGKASMAAQLGAETGHCGRANRLLRGQSGRQIAGKPEDRVAKRTLNGHRPAFVAALANSIYPSLGSNRYDPPF